MATATKENTKIEEQETTETLPAWRVILHNDKVNKFEVVMSKVQEFIRVDQKIAYEKTFEAHNKGQSILLYTNQEHAEFIQSRFMSCRPKIFVTIEKV
jgi:ATP-dependent Clp protease adapter protein ClpS